MKKIVSSFAIAALMTFGFADSSIAQEGGSSNVATQAQEGKTKADTPEEAVELDFVQTLKQKYIEGDPFWMTPVLICLIIGLALSIERIVYLNLSTINTKKFLDEVETALKNGGVEAAKDVCRNTRGPIASIFYQGLDRSEEGIEMVKKYDHVVSSDLQHWLEYVNMNEDEFWKIADTFRDPRVWWIENGDWYKNNIWGTKSSYGKVYLAKESWAKYTLGIENI